MSTYLERSAESEREYEAKRQVARKRHGRPFASDLGSNWKPHEKPFLDRWMRGEIKLEANDAPGT